MLRRPLSFCDHLRVIDSKNSQVTGEIAGAYVSIINGACASDLSEEMPLMSKSWIIIEAGYDGK
jgi:hypothetical protein